ncbi:MAG: Holliday junction resolvase RuvX [Butyrivibrio sp.]|nr:Holliday junction resolvase RuvX [Butyrivibrio sp.]
MRIMGLDYGSKTVGVAISDELLLTAQAKEIIRRKEENKLRKTLSRIEELIQEYDVKRIVLGLPLNMDQSESVRSALSEEFRDKLERRTSLPVIMWDERLTSVMAEEIMDEVGIKRSEYKEYVDMIAAQIILQDYLDNRDKTDEE